MPIVSVKQQQCNAMLSWVHQEKIAIRKANVHTEELLNDVFQITNNRVKYNKYKYYENKGKNSIAEKMKQITLFFFFIVKNKY